MNWPRNIHSKKLHWKLIRLWLICSWLALFLLVLLISEFILTLCRCSFVYFSVNQRAQNGTYKVLGDSLRGNPESLFKTREDLRKLMSSLNFAYAGVRFSMVLIRRVTYEIHLLKNYVLTCRLIC